jgi:hypothetical protein
MGTYLINCLYYETGGCPFLTLTMDTLTPTQEIALAQLQTITNGESDVAMSVLESVDWDVQVLLLM